MPFQQQPACSHCPRGGLREGLSSSERLRAARGEKNKGWTFAARLRRAPRSIIGLHRVGERAGRRDRSGPSSRLSSRRPVCLNSARHEHLRWACPIRPLPSTSQFMEYLLFKVTRDILFPIRPSPSTSQFMEYLLFKVTRDILFPIRPSPSTSQFNSMLFKVTRDILFPIRPSPSTSQFMEYLLFKVTRDILFPIRPSPSTSQFMEYLLFKVTRDVLFYFIFVN